MPLSAIQPGLFGPGRQYDTVLSGGDGGFVSRPGWRAFLIPATFSCPSRAVGTSNRSVSSVSPSEGVPQTV